MANLNPVLGSRYSGEDLRSFGLPQAFIDDYLELTEIVYNLNDTVAKDFPGNPNGNVFSNRSRLCFDTVGGVMYFNPDVGVNTGWVAI